MGHGGHAFGGAEQAPQGRPCLTFHSLTHMAAVSAGTVLCYATLRYATLRYATLRYATLCYATLRYAMLCYAMLCYAMLCYALLCCTWHEWNLWHVDSFLIMNMCLSSGDRSEYSHEELPV